MSRIRTASRQRPAARKGQTMTENLPIYLAFALALAATLAVLFVLAGPVLRRRLRRWRRP